MGSKSAPAPQDFTAAAQAMGQSGIQNINAQTAANRPDQYMPGGSSVTWQNTPGSYNWGDQGAGSQAYQQAGQTLWDKSDAEKAAWQAATTSDGFNQGAYDQARSQWMGGVGQEDIAKQLGIQKSADQWTQTTQLGPEAQKAFDAQQQLGTARSQQGLSLFNQQADAISRPLDQASTQWGQTPQQSQLQTSVGQSQLQNSINPGQQVQGQLGLQTSLGPQQQAQGQLGSEQLSRAFDFGGAPQAMGPTAANQQGYDAAMGLAKRQLDPAWNQRSEAFDADLANQGLRQGDKGYDDAKANFERSRNDAYGSAQNQATLTGAQLGNQLFGQSMQGRQQGVNEAMAQGNFGNQAALGQFGMGLQQGQFANQAAGQNFQQGLQSGQFGNQAMLAAGQFANQAQQQQYQQALGQAGLYNQAAGQQFQQGLAGAQFGNQAQGQQFSQEQANAAYQNQLRQAQLQEQMTQRGFALNQVNGLLGGQQVSMPQFTGFNQAGAAAPTNYLGAAQAQQSANMQQYQAQQQQWAQLYQGAAGLAGGAMSFI